MRPLKGHVLVQPARSDNEFYLPNPPKPISGFIWAKSSNSRDPYSEGDFVVFEEEGLEQPSLLQDTMFLRLRDRHSVHIVRVDSDIEPVIHEVTQRYRTRRDDRWLTVRDLDRENEPVRFLASDIIDFGIGTYTESGYSVSYVHHTPIHPLDTGLGHPELILIPEKNILFFIRREDLENPSRLNGR